MSKRGIRSSLSADDVGSAAKKPGKLSADFIARFESDSAIGGSTSAIPKRISQASSSDLTSKSHDHLESIKPHVKIAEPVHVTKYEDEATSADEKKRKSIWKWSPLKKMRRFFSRKKSKGQRRTKSFEELPTESYRPKSTSDDRLYEHGKSSPVVRTSTLPPNTKAPIVRELRDRHGSSSEDMGASFDSIASKTRSLPALTSPAQIYTSTEEAGVSFESDPNSTSLEGLQAARDKIKAAPKRRRPPSRKSTSSLSTHSPVHKESKTQHRRSKTDPKELTSNDASFAESNSNSDILNNTIFEEEEAMKSPPGTVKETSPDKSKEVKDDITSRVNRAMERTTGPPKLSVNEVQSTHTKDESNEADTFSERVLKKKEETSKTQNSQLPERETAISPRKEEFKITTSTKKDISNSKGKSSDDNALKPESKRLSLNENTKKSFTESIIVSSKSDSNILRAEFTSLLQSEPSDKLFLDEKTGESRRETSSIEDTSQPQRQAIEDKLPQTNTKPFKRGKSWSNNHSTKLIEIPIKQEKESKKNSMHGSTSGQTDGKENENDSAQDSGSKDFRFSRTKSWSYGMKPGDLAKANQSSQPLNSAITTNESTDEQEAPSWVAKANRMSQRISQLMQDDDSSDNETPTLRKKVTQKSEPPNTKSAVAEKTVKPGQSNKPLASTNQDPKPSINKPSTNQNSEPSINKPPTNQDSKPSINNSSPIQVPKSTANKLSNSQEPKPLINKPSIKDSKPTQSSPKPTPAPRPKPSSLVRNSASLPRFDGSAAKSDTKSMTTNTHSTSRTDKNTVDSKKSAQQIAKPAFGNAKIEKCIVCGTTVYQMEKCKFDDSVLHRNCIKCSVCKRHLTVGNFVMTESKIYCNSHGQASVTVST